MMLAAVLLLAASLFLNASAGGGPRSGNRRMFHVTRRPMARGRVTARARGSAGLDRSRRDGAGKDWRDFVQGRGAYGTKRPEKPCMNTCRNRFPTKDVCRNLCLTNCKAGRSLRVQGCVGWKEWETTRAPSRQSRPAHGSNAARSSAARQPLRAKGWTCSKFANGKWGEYPC